MRIIGHLPNEASALTFSDFLYVQGIHNQVEREHEGWAVWIHSEDELEKAKSLLDNYKANPNDPRFHKHARRASELKAQEIEEDRAAKEKTFDRTKIFKSTMPYGTGPLTVLLVVASVAITGLVWSNADKSLYKSLLITEHVVGLPEIARGQIWRLFTSVFLHGGPYFNQWGLMHIVFNMWWLIDLGSMIEGRQSSRSLLALVLVLGVVSNVAQWSFAGPSIGMSGVVYGLLGYIWMKGRFDPSSGLFLHQQTVLMMLIWFFVCWFFMRTVIANYAHTAGLVLGAVWGVLASAWARRRR
jgi:GlpG protein